MTGDTHQRVQDRYYVGFIAATIVCFLPFKLGAYLVPTAFTLWMSSACLDVVPRLVKVAYVALLVALFYEVTSSEFLIGNYLLALVTFSAFVAIIAIPTRQLASRVLLRKILRFVIVLLVAECLLGLVQAVYGAIQTGSFGGANGDFVEGTIHPQLASEQSMSNPMFAINIAFLLLGCLSEPTIFQANRNRLLFGLVVLILASVVHALVFLIVAAVIAFLLTRARTTARRRALGTARLVAWGAVVVVIGSLSVPQIGGAYQTIEEALDMENFNFPRAIYLYRVATELPDDAPQQPFIGMGPGQFGSRASVIGAGFVGGGSIPLLSPQATSLAEDYCFSLQRAMEEVEYGIGSTQQPFSSILTIYTELGVLGLLVVVYVIRKLVATTRRRLRMNPDLRPRIYWFLMSLMFLVLLGFQENYWEVPQAIFVGLLLMKVMYAVIVDPTASDHEEQQRDSVREGVT